MGSNNHLVISEGSVVHESTGAAAGGDTASSDEHNQQQVQSQAVIRSYECSFCKKGFSNAQALGGHMNIHRKDKAKFKKAAAAAAAARLPTPDCSPNKGNNKQLGFTASSRQLILGKDVIKWGDIFGNNQVVQQQEVVSSFARLRNESQMAETMLVVETTANKKRFIDYSKSIMSQQQQQQQVSANWQQQMLLHSTNGGNGGGSSSSMSAGLDLELRLGHSASPLLPPPESSSITTGSFLKFF